MSKRIWVDALEMVSIQKVRAEYNLPTDKAALSHIIADYERMRNKRRYVRDEVKAVLEEKLEEFQPVIDRIKWASSEAERNTIMILDGLNAQYIYEDMRSEYLFEEIEAPVFRKSKDRIKEKISHFKQKKDERIAKQGKSKK